MNWDAFLKIGLFAVGLGVAFYIPAHFWVKHTLKRHPGRWEQKYTLPLSKRTIVFWLIASVVFFLVIFALTTHLYPWFGVPIFGYSGLLPFVLGWLLVHFAFSLLPVFRSNKSLSLGVSLPIGILLGILFLWYLGSRFGNELKELF